MAGANVVSKSFEVTGISNELDGTKDDLVHAGQRAGAQPVLLGQRQK